MTTDLKIEYFSPKNLIAYERNARTHSKKQVGQIAASISEFGFANPILIDANNTIIAGHGRLQAAKQLKLEQVPCIRLPNLTEAQKRAFVLADNKLALNAGWDEQILALELKALTEIELDFDIELTGFSIGEIDTLIDLDHPEEPNAPEDDQLPERPAEARCQLGDVWQLGTHRLICGNSLDRDVVSQLMGTDLATVVFTDPPYNVKIAGNVGGLGAIKHREFAMASGEMTEDAFTQFLHTAFQNLVAFSVDGSIHYICMDWRHVGEVLSAADGIYSELKNLIVWVKDNGGMGTFYRSRHELIFAFKSGTKAHINTFELGQHGRYRTNVWEYKGVNSFGSGRLDDLALHPTVKPVQMIADALKDVSGRGDIVLDLFGGSGSTLIAAEKTGRRARLCELDPVYCDRIINRWETLFKDDAILLEREGASVVPQAQEWGIAA